MVQGALVVPAIWRLALHLGVMVLVWSGVRYFRRREGARGRISTAHGFLIALAALTVAGAMVAWRVVGAFSPYFGW